VSVTKTRGFLYQLARLLGDWSAVSSGDARQMTKRVGRRAAGKATGLSGGFSSNQAWPLGRSRSG